MTATTTRRLAHSTGAATFSQAWRMGVTFLTTLVLTRLVSPGDWGLYDWAIVVFMVLGAVRDLGLGYHIIRLKPRPYGNLLLVELAWGAALAILAFVCADWIALAFRRADANLVPVLRALCAYLFLEGLATVPRIFFDAELRVGRTVLPEVVRNLLFAGTALVLAILGYGVWSMTLGLIVGTAYYAIHLWVRAWPVMELNFERGATLALIRPSLPLAAIWLLAILARHVDPLLLARVFTEDTVGQYTRAYFFAFLVMITLVPAVTRVLYPALVEYETQPKKLSEAYRLATVLVLTFEVPLAAFLFLNPRTFFSIFGSEWIAGPAPLFLRVLALTPLADPFSRLGGEILKVYHRDRIWIASLLVTVLTFAGAGFLLIRSMGAVGMAWANYLPLGGLIMAWGISKIAPGPFWRLVRDIVWIYLVPVLPFGAVYLTTQDSPWWRFGLSILAVLVCCGIYWWRFGAAFLEFFRHPAEAAAEVPAEPIAGP